MNKTIKRITAAFMAAALIGTAGISSHSSSVFNPIQSISASAASAVTWSNDTATFTYSVTGSKAIVSKIAFKNAKNSEGKTYVYVPGTINNYKVVLGSHCFEYVNAPLYVNCSTVSEIQPYAFYCCTGIEDLSFDKACTKVGSYAFYYCNGLKSVSFMGERYADHTGSSLSIESYAFYGCSNLNAVSFGCRDNIIIKRDAFKYCWNLKNFDKWTASSDHCSMYVQEGAFNASGIISNKNAVRTQDDIAKYESRTYNYNAGDSKKMLGKTAVISLFVNIQGATPFSSSDKSVYNNRAGACTNTLVQEANKYGKTVSFTNYNVNVNYPGDYAAFRGLGTSFINTSYVLTGMKNKFSFLSGCTSMDSVSNLIKKNYGVDNVSYVVVLNVRGEYNYSWPQLNKNEFAVIHFKGTNGYNITYTWMHEFCHLFGAPDQYGSASKNEGYINQFNGDDIMYHLYPSVGWFTACCIGWTDTVLADDYDVLISA